MRIWAIRASIPIIPRLGDVAVLAGLVTAGEQQKVKVSTDQDREAAIPSHPAVNIQNIQKMSLSFRTKIVFSRWQH